MPKALKAVLTKQGLAGEQWILHYTVADLQL